jgi:hypothetical protein
VPKFSGDCELKKQEEARASLPGGESSTKNKKSERNWLGLAATVVSGIAVALTLMGYGVSFAAESMFGMPHASVFDSALDLTDLSSYAIEQLLTTVPQKLFDQAVYDDVYRKSWPVLAPAIAASIAIAGFAWHWGRHRKHAKREPVKKVVPRAADDPARKLRNGMLGLALFLPSLPLVGVLLIVLISSLCSLIAVAPMLGMVGGMAYLREWVVEPEICVPAMSRDDRMKIPSRSPTGIKGSKAVNCVVALRDGLELARGRVVFMTTKSLVLFDPATGAVRKVPTSTNVVQLVSAFGASAGSSAPVGTASQPASGKLAGS